MKRNQLKSLIKNIIQEVAGLTKQDDPGVMGAVNVEESDWEKPEEKRYSSITPWAKDNLEQDGTYKGEPLHNYGFIYKVGEKVPMTKYHLMNAMHLWNVAKKKRNDNLALGKPVGFEEMTGTGAVGAVSTPFAFKKKGIDEMTDSGAAGSYLTKGAFTNNPKGSPKAIAAAKKYGKVVGEAPRV